MPVAPTGGSCRGGVESGFSVVELLISTAVMMVVMALATGLLLESQIQIARLQAEMRNPLPRYAVERLRHDLEGAAAVPALLEGWRAGRLTVVGDDGTQIVWLSTGGELHRILVAGDGTELSRQRILGDVTSWRWRRLGGSLVDISFGVRLHRAAGAPRVGVVSAMTPRSSVRESRLRVWLRRAGP